MIFLLSSDFFKTNFKKNCFRNTIRVSNVLDPDHDRHSVSPDLLANCLQTLSAEDKRPYGHGWQDLSRGPL